MSPCWSPPTAAGAAFGGRLNNASRIILGATVAVVLGLVVYIASQGWPSGDDGAGGPSALLGPGPATVQPDASRNGAGGTGSDAGIGVAGSQAIAAAPAPAQDPGGVSGRPAADAGRETPIRASLGGSEGAGVQQPVAQVPAPAPAPQSTPAAPPSAPADEAPPAPIVAPGSGPRPAGTIIDAILTPPEEDEAPAPGELPGLDGAPGLSQYVWVAGEGHDHYHYVQADGEEICPSEPAADEDAEPIIPPILSPPEDEDDAEDPVDPATPPIVEAILGDAAPAPGAEAQAPSDEQQ